MSTNASHPHSQHAPDTSVARRDRALRLRFRVLLSTVASAVLAAGGLGVLAEHTYAGHATATSSNAATSTSGTPSSASSSSSSSSTSSSDPSSSNSGSTASTSAPSSSSGTTTIVSGGS